MFNINCNCTWNHGSMYFNGLWIFLTLFKVSIASMSLDRYDDGLKPLEEQNKMAVVICSFPVLDYESFKLFRALPRDIEFMYLVDICRFIHRDVHLTLNNFIYRGHDIGLQVIASCDNLTSHVDYLTMFLEAREFIRAICGYNVQYIAVESSQVVSLEFRKAAKIACLDIFQYHKLGNTDDDANLIGANLLSARELNLLVDFIRVHKSDGRIFSSIPEFHKGSIETVLLRKALHIVLSGIPKCKRLRSFVKGLLRRTDFKCSVLVDFKACTKRKKLKKYRKAFKLGAVPIYFLDNSSDTEISWSEIDVAFKSFGHLAKGRAELRRVLLRDSDKIKGLRKWESGTGITFCYPSLTADGQIAPKAVKMYMADLRPGSTVLLKVRTAKDHRDYLNLKEILSHISESVEFKE